MTTVMGPRLGTLRSELAVATLVPDNTPAPGGVGTMLGAYESDTGAPLAPLPFALESETARGSAGPATAGSWPGETKSTIPSRWRCKEDRSTTAA